MLAMHQLQIEQLKRRAPFSWMCSSFAYDLWYGYHPDADRRWHPTNEEILKFFDAKDPKEVRSGG